MNMQKILLPTDFSAACEPSLQYGLDLAERLSAEVVLVHAYSVPVYPVMEGMLIAPPTLLVEIATHSAAELEKLRARVQRPSLRISTRAIEGPAAEGIVACAREEHCDLIVMGTHGRTGWRRLAVGSVAERVMRTAMVPVLTVGSKSEPWTEFFDAPPIL